MDWLVSKLVLDCHRGCVLRHAHVRTRRPWYTAVTVESAGKRAPLLRSSLSRTIRQETTSTEGRSLGFIANRRLRRAIIQIGRRPGMPRTTYGLEGKMLNTKLVTWALGIWAAVSFVLCVVYGLMTPQSLHMSDFLEMVLPAFKWHLVGISARSGRELFVWRLRRLSVLPDLQLVEPALGHRFNELIRQLVTMEFATNLTLIHINTPFREDASF